MSYAQKKRWKTAAQKSGRICSALYSGSEDRAKYADRAQKKGVCATI